jgi:hypothetical protein
VVSHRRTSISLTATALLLVLAGCGGGSSSTTTTTSTAAPQARGTSHTGRSGGTGVIVLPRGVGSLSYGCDRAHGQVEATLGGRIEATESVYVEGDDHRHLRASRGVSSSPFAVTGARSGTLLWHVIQSTEPRTLDVRIAIDFGRATSGPACARTRWTSTVYVISHDKPWSEPPGWL